MFLTQMAGFAEFERNQIAERTAMALQHKRARLEVYSATPLGFRRTNGNKLRAIPREIAIVRVIRERRAAGESLRAIADNLNAAGLKGKQGGRFYGSTVRQILNNPLYRSQPPG